LVRAAALRVAARRSFLLARAAVWVRLFLLLAVPVLQVLLAAVRASGLSRFPR
jgi:hypothetical protein